MDSEEDVLDFWFGRPDAQGYGEEREMWWNQDPSFDALVVERFGAFHQRAIAGDLEAWRRTPSGCLAYVLMLDQLSRHLYRNQARAYAGDARALSAAKHAVEHGFDMALPPFQRQFLYMPFMHSEELKEQTRSVALFDALAEAEPRVDQRRWAREHFDTVARLDDFATVTPCWGGRRSRRRSHGVSQSGLANSSRSRSGRPSSW